VGAESSGQLSHRAALALAGRLGQEPIEFPGDHTGFAGAGPAFAARLRQVLRHA
jgi:clorobiocin biosynthesis protein CloN7